MSTSPKEYPNLTSALRDRIVTKVAETVRDCYVFEDEAARMADHLHSQSKAGAFEAIETISELTTTLLSELNGVHEDLHVYVGPWLPPADGADNAADQAYEEFLTDMPRTNFDFRKLEILLGNIGYLDLRSFCPARIAGDTATAAMQFLAHADALVFDLRDNGGGDDLVQYLQSYLFSEPTHMITQKYRPERIQQTWTYSHVPGPRFPDVPVYILMSRTSFSAAEDFAFTLQRQERAVVIGEQTRGGAHPVEFYRFPDLYLELMLPNGCSHDPITGDNWEETGVIPDIKASADDALAVAHELALQTLLSQPADEAKTLFRTWAIESVRSRRWAMELPADQLSLYVGQYGKSIEVSADDGRLRFCWGKRRNHIMTPIAAHRFEFDHGTQRALFKIHAGLPTELMYQLQDGREWKMPRKG